MKDVGFWRIHCHIGHHPGQWQHWFRDQCCAVGWPPSKWADKEQSGWSFSSDDGSDRDFTTTINHLSRMNVGDWIVATLPGSRVGRLGKVVELRVKDEEWDPIVKPSLKNPLGENGRRILVRWELNVGPADASQVVLLPPHARFNGGEIRGTIRSIPMDKLDVIRDAMNDPANWVSLGAMFKMETALSAYIAVHPHRLEDGMVAHPSLDATELKLPDGGRADVILEDKSGRLVVVECKQGAPTIAALEQVDRYRFQLQDYSTESGKPRAMVVHGGSRRVSADVVEEAKTRDIELVFFELQVNFVST